MDASNNSLERVDDDDYVASMFPEGVKNGLSSPKQSTNNIHNSQVNLNMTPTQYPMMQSPIVGVGRLGSTSDDLLYGMGTPDPNVMAHHYASSSKKSSLIDAKTKERYP